MGTIGASADTRLWNDEAGRQHVKEFLHVILSNKDLVCVAVEKRLLSFYRVWNLITDPHVKVKE